MKEFWLILSVREGVSRVFIKCADETTYLDAQSELRISISVLG